MSERDTANLFEGIVKMFVLFVIFIFLLTGLYYVVSNSVILTGISSYDMLLGLVPLFFAIAVSVIMYSRYVNERSD